MAKEEQREIGRRKGERRKENIPINFPDRRKAKRRKKDWKGT